MAGVTGATRRMGQKNAILPIRRENCAQKQSERWSMAPLIFNEISKFNKKKTFKTPLQLEKAVCSPFGFGSLKPNGGQAEHRGLGL